ncbi:MAG: zinc-ribbon domain-containing protein [Chloroflexi bacterium]|nr:zinc-ribbon domain-containing protein [Chloroflexota bacterium]
MITFIALLLTVLTFFIVVYPFLKERFQVQVAAPDDRKTELFSRRHTAYSMIKELEFDYQSGILSEDDYRELLTRYQDRAISILKDIDGAEKVTTDDDDIERQILAMRKRGPRIAAPVKAAAPDEDGEGAVDDDIEKQVRAMRRRGSRSAQAKGVEIEKEVEAGAGPAPLSSQGKGQFCPQCGTRHEAEDRFCAQCGTKLGRIEG